MATSGTYTFNLDAAETIEEAYERAGVQVTAITGHDLVSARRSLNLLFADWVNDQINLWTVEEVFFTTTTGDETETLATGTVDVLDCYLRRDGTDTEMIRISRDEYALLPNKDQQGRPHHFFVERFVDSVVMTLWLTPENSTDQVRFYRIRQLQDVGDYTNTLDAPQRWQEAICAGLAVKLAMKRPEMDPVRLEVLRADYAMAYGRAKMEDRERTTTRIVPAVHGR